MFKLSWYKLLSTETTRRRSRKQNSDVRHDFEKDNHRIISSASYRRLQDKTQVFPLEENDFVRTRLTHSIEVSSFARSLAQSVSEKIIGERIDPEFNFEQMNGIMSVLASAGLLHDIGNPPFGHSGEVTIRSWFEKNIDNIYLKDFSGNEKKLSEILNERMKGDFLNFEGNAQVLRVVSKLHYVVDENGMNLTFALLNTLIKYPNTSLDIDKQSGNIKDKKMGYYLAEDDLFKKIVNETGTYIKEENKYVRHPLTFLLEAADDIAYTTADIEDGLKKQIITFNDILEALDEFNITKGNIYYDRLIKYYEDAKKIDYEPDIKSYASQRWIISIQGLIVKDVVQNFIDNYESIMNGEYKKDLFYNTNSDQIIQLFRKIVNNKIINSRTIVMNEIAAHNMINFLLDKFVKSVIYFDTKYEKEQKAVYNKYIELLSTNYKRAYFVYSKKYEEDKWKEFNEELEKTKIETEKKMNRLKAEYEEDIYAYKLYLRILLITDYISGMTDTYAKTLYQQLKGID